MTRRNGQQQDDQPRSRNGAAWWAALPDRLAAWSVIGVAAGVVWLVGWVLLGAL